MITGTLTRNANGKTFTASVSTMMFDIARISVVENTWKTSENHPDHHLEVRTPRGRVLRVGSMWNAVSEKSGNAYFQLSLTDRMGRNWRMNAVRSEDTPEGTWKIVPLALGKTDPITLTGRIETLDDDNLAGFIGSYDFDMSFTAVENEHRTDSTHPHWHIETRSPAGQIIRMGSVWKAVSERTGVGYLSLAFSTPTGTQHCANAFHREDAPAGEFEIVAMTGGNMAAVA